MGYQTLTIEIESSVATLTLSRPEALNALNSVLLEELSKALREIKNQIPSQVRGLVITGAGEKAFVAGADIKEMQGLNEAQAHEFARKGQGILKQIEDLPCPVIAAVNGFALGGGLELALSCDFIFASENARLGLPEVSLGLIPGFGGTVRLSRVVGLNKAREIVMTGEMWKANEALSWGLVNRVFPQAELLSQARKTLQTIASRGPLAVARAKKSILQTFDQDQASAMQTEAQLFSGLFGKTDTREGLAAFLEKRKAQFEGKDF